MNNYFNQNSYEEEKKKAARLPHWVWIIGIFGLILSILMGASSGTEAALMCKQVVSSVMLRDTNGEDTSLQSLNFSEFICVFDNVYGFNLLDCKDSYAFSYASTVKYNNSRGMYPNDFSKVDKVNYTVTFASFNHYDLTYAKKAEKETTFTFSSSLTKGNLEARLLRIDENYRIKTDELGYSVIEDTFIHTEASFKAGEESSVTLPGGFLYVLAVGCESADGSYTFKAE